MKERRMRARALVWGSLVVAMLAFANSLRSSGGSSSGGSGGGYGSGGSLPQIVNTGVVTASAPHGPVTSASSITARPMNQYSVFVIGEDAKPGKDEAPVERTHGQGGVPGIEKLLQPLQLALVVTQDDGARRAGDELAEILEIAVDQLG